MTKSICTFDDPQLNLEFEQKRCARCDVIKGASQFYPRQRWCKSCHSDYHRARYAVRRQRISYVTPTEKRCGACKQVKIADQFSRRCDGLQSACRDCALERGRRIRARNNKRSTIEIEIPLQKRCGTCKIVKDADQFDRCRSRTDGLQPRCKSCQIEYRRRVLVQDRHSARKRNYGITPQDYDLMLKKQDGRCAICRQTPSAAPKGILYIDHDHQTDAVRGLLCQPCNTAIGLLKDRPDLMISAARYLGRKISTQVGG